MGSRFEKCSSILEQMIKRFMNDTWMEKRSSEYVYTISKYVYVCFMSTSSSAVSFIDIVTEGRRQYPHNFPVDVNVKDRFHGFKPLFSTSMLVLNRQQCRVTPPDDAEHLFLQLSMPHPICADL